MKPIFYVYVYLDPRKPGNYTYGDYQFDYEPFYVGKGSNGRMYEHLIGNKYNLYFDRIIKKIKTVCNIDPIVIKYQDMLLEQDSFDLEIDMIETIGRHNIKNGPLCNLMEGGHGGSGYKHTKKSKQIISEKLKGKQSGSKHHMYGKHHSEETREKIKKSVTGQRTGDKHHMYGKHHTKEAILKIKQKRSNQIISPEHMLKMRSSWTGKHTDETKLKISLANKGKRVSSKTKRKISETLRRKNDNNFTVQPET